MFKRAKTDANMADSQTQPQATGQTGHINSSSGAKDILRVEDLFNKDKKES